MKLRLIKKGGQRLLLCPDKTIAFVDDSLLRRLFVCYQDVSLFSGNDGYWNEGGNKMENFSGQTLAYVNDKNELCLVENPFISIMRNLADDEYITLHEYAELHGKNDNRIKLLCREGRIPGALKKAGKWFIPKHSPYPKDARYSGVEK